VRIQDRVRFVVVSTSRFHPSHRNQRCHADGDIANADQGDPRRQGGRQVILADEPVASLDPESAATVLETLRSVVATGVAVVASLHQVHLARAYADRLVALRQGEVIEDAPVASFDARAIEQIYERNGEAAGGARA
jgi:ABC-type hemin transport system ATPase subunit